MHDPPESANGLRVASPVDHEFRPGNVVRRLREREGKAAKQEAPDPLVGRMVNEYQVESVIGKGGFGKVYKAKDVQLNRYAALKFLPRTPSAALMEDIEREAQTLAAVSKHPGIVEIYSFGDYEGRPYFALEYVPGSAREKLRESPTGLPMAQALQITRDCAEALAYAHEQGVLHRDIKPDNILIDPETGKARLADFGLARFVSKTSEGKRREAVIGTPPYMSPEHIKGAPLDVRADVFSLGVTFYELLCGKLPFEGKTRQDVFDKIVNSQGVALRERKHALPQGVAELVERATNAERDKRFADAQEMAQALRAYLNRPKRRKRAFQIAAAVAAGIAAGAIIMSGLFTSGALPVPAKTTQGQIEAFQADQEGQAAALAAIRPWELSDQNDAPPPAGEVLDHDAYLEAFSQMRNNLFAKAKATLERIVAKGEKDQILRATMDYFPNRELGAAYLALGRYDEAIKSCQHSYAAVRTERALEIIGLAVGELGQEGNAMDQGEPWSESLSARREAQYTHRWIAAHEYVLVEGDVQDDFLVRSVRVASAQVPGFRRLPRQLGVSLPVSYRVPIRRGEEELTVKVADFSGNTIEIALKPEGGAEFMRDSFKTAARPIKDAAYRLAATWLPKPKVCYAEAAEASLLSGTQVRILNPKDGDVILRPEAFLEWNVASPDVLDSVQVDGQEYVRTPARTNASGKWIPLEAGTNRLEVAARSKADPVNKPIRQSVSFLHKEAPKPSSAGAYLASPASKASLMVLAFEDRSELIGGDMDIRVLFEEQLATAYDQRFDVRYLSAVAPLLAKHQTQAALASQEEALRVAKSLPVEYFLCGSLVDFSGGTEIVAKLLVARTGAVLTSAAAYVLPGEDLSFRIAELCQWLADDVPRIMGVTGQCVAFESGQGEQAMFVTNLSAADGLRRNQYLSVFRDVGGECRQRGRARVVRPGEPYSICVSVDYDDYGEGFTEASLPQPGDLVLVR